MPYLADYGLRCHPSLGDRLSVVQLHQAALSATTWPYYQPYRPASISLWGCKLWQGKCANPVKLVVEWLAGKS